MFTLHGYGSKLLVLAGFCLVIGSIFSLAAFALVDPIFGIPATDLSTITNNLEDPNNLNALKFIQLFNSLGIFIFPPILFLILFSTKPFKYVHLDFMPKAYFFGMIILLFLFSMPLLNWLVEWNQQIDLPDALSGIENWMRESEEKAMELTEALIHMDNVGQLVFNLFLIAIIPAVGEELLFRGLVQKFFGAWTNNYHIGIWVAAILFSALHFQFFGFFPRLALGVLFGYLLVSTGSLWIPIFAHFINNATALVLSYFYGFNTMENEVEKLGTSPDTTMLIIPSAILFFGFLYFFFKKAKEEKFSISSNEPEKIE